MLLGPIHAMDVGPQGSRLVNSSPTTNRNQRRDHHQLQRPFPIHPALGIMGKVALLNGQRQLPVTASAGLLSNVILAEAGPYANVCPPPLGKYCQSAYGVERTVLSTVWGVK